MQHLTLKDIEEGREYYEECLCDDMLFYLYPDDTVYHLNDDSDNYCIVKNICEQAELQLAEETISYSLDEFNTTKQRAKKMNKPLTKAELENAASKIDLEKVKSMAYRDVLTDELVRERIRTAVQVVQYEEAKEQAERDLEKLTTANPVNDEQVRATEEKIAFFRREGIKKLKLAKEHSRILNSENVITRIITVLKETE